MEQWEQPAIPAPAEPRPADARWSRRQFLGGAGALSLAAALASCGGSSKGSGSAGPTHARFHSRPDLRPPLVRVRGVGPAAPGYSFITPAGPLIVDAAGEPVWIHPVPHSATNLQVQQYRGQPVLTWWQGEIAHYGVGLRGHNVILDRSYRQVATVRPGRGLPSDLHEFTLTAEGTALLTAYTPMRADLTSVGGPQRGTLLDAIVQELDVATGAVLMEWRSSDHVQLSETHVKYSSTSTRPFDPVHVNSIAVLPDGNLLICARNTWAVYKVERHTGRVIWRLGGKRSDFSLGKGVRFAWQHHARWHPGNLMSVFDDEGDPPAGPQSRGLVLRVDETSRHVSLVRAYLHPKSRLLAGSQGSVQLLDDGHVLVGWGSKPYYTEFRHDGSWVLDAEMATGESYRAFRYEWRGTPTDLPAAAGARTTGGATVYASWNGATDVVAWRALGGAEPTHLVVVGTAGRRGFETAVPVSGVPLWVAVEALDGSGSVLAASKPVRVG